MNLLKKLEQHLEEIHIEQKLNSGNVITDSDIKKLLKLIKDKDIEVKPLVLIIENLMSTLDYKKDYKLVEQITISMLKYYNILENENFRECRHKYFFSDDKKLIKTKYFKEEHINNIKPLVKDIIEKL